MVKCNKEYSWRTNLSITKTPCEKDETPEKVPEKVKKLVNEIKVDILDLNIDRTHGTGTKKAKNRQSS